MAETSEVDYLLHRLAVARLHHSLRSWSPLLTAEGGAVVSEIITSGVYET